MNLVTSPVVVLLGVVALLAGGCRPAVPPGAVVLTQSPIAVRLDRPLTGLDVRYPLGSRVVLVVPPYRQNTSRVLSGHLVAAGDPVISWDGRRVYFVGKPKAAADWQIYEVGVDGGRPRRVTQMPGGAMDPALAAHGELVFTSPVPPVGRTWTTRRPAALYGQMPDQAPHRLTFCPDSAVDATVLRDGRVLFVTAEARDDRRAPPHLSLFTINTDGTEVTAYACQDDGVNFIRRPRELSGGRVAFLAAGAPGPAPGPWAECVEADAPFATRTNLFRFPVGGCRSVEPLPDGAVLACLATYGLMGRSMAANYAVFRTRPNATGPGTPLFYDPDRNSIEATPVVRRVEPAGHTSDLTPGAAEGTILCLNVNDSISPTPGQDPAPAAELRVFALTASGARRTLGQVPVASDGSVMAALPVGLALGFDTLDARGHRLRHQPAFLWLMPGEDRGCVGCHEPRDHAPRNIRPLATLVPPWRLGFAPQSGASRASAP